MSTNQKIRAIAASLPPLPKLRNNKVQYTNVMERIKGEDILKQKEDATEKDGSPILDYKVYQRMKKVPVLLDHFTTMKGIYKNSGADGVNKYIALAFEFNKIVNPGIKFE